MRKITSILMLLLFVFSSGVSAQGFTVSTGADKHWFVIKNFRSGKFAAYGGEENAQEAKKDICQKTLNELTDACYWYAVADGEGYKLYNAAATGKVVDGHGWSETGRTMYVKASSLLSGYYTISTETDPTSTDANNTYGCWDDQVSSNGIGFWKHVKGDEKGTAWLLVNVDDPATLVSKEKVALAVRVAEPNFLVGVNPGQYPSTDAYSSALTAAQEILNSTAATKDDYESKLTALEDALAQAQTQTKNDLKVGCYYRIQNTVHKTYTGVALYDANYKTDSRMYNYALNQMDPCQIWKLEEAGGKKFLVNVGTGLYPQYINGGNPAPNSDAGAKNENYDFTCEKHTDVSAMSMPVFNIKIGGRQVNIEPDGKVDYWYQANAHHYLWKVEKTDDEILALVKDWVSAKNMTANSGAKKMQVVGGDVKVISPSEFAEPSVVNAAIDAVKAYTDAAEPSLSQAQAVCNNYAIVNNYVSQTNTYGDILGYVYDLKGQYGTIILPVNYATPDNVKFYTCADADANGVLTLVETNTGNKKNQPYIVEYTGEDELTPQNPKKYQIFGYKKGALTTNQKVGLLTGVLEEGTVYVPSGSYILSKYKDRFAFYKVDGENVKKAQQYRCYLTNPAPTAVSAFYLNGEGETTGINALLNGNNGETEIYDLSGKRLNHLQKGINIVNGQKVLVK